MVPVWVELQGLPSASRQIRSKKTLHDLPEHCSVPSRPIRKSLLPSQYHLFIAERDRTQESRQFWSAGQIDRTSGMNTEVAEPFLVQLQSSREAMFTCAARTVAHWHLETATCRGRTDYGV